MTKDAERHQWDICGRFTPYLSIKLTTIPAFIDWQTGICNNPITDPEK